MDNSIDDDHEIDPRDLGSFALITSESSNMPRSSTLKVCPRQSLHVLLSQVSQELLSLADITLVLLSISDTHCECAVRKKKKNPVILYSHGTCWLFVDEGVFKQPNNFLSTYYRIVIWTLVDSMDTSLSVPGIGLTEHGTQHFILYTRSTDSSRWDKVHQSMCRGICVMTP